MKILLLTSRLPYPPYRGDKLKIFNLIKQLSSDHSITLVSFISSRRDLEHLQHLEAYCHKVIPVYLPTWKSFCNCLLNIAGRLPFQVAYYASRRMSDALAAELAAEHYDIAHIHLIRMAPYAVGMPSMPHVLDLTDASSLYLSRFLATTSNPVYGIMVRMELGRMVAYEQILESFDVSLVCSEVDRKELMQHAPRANIQLLYNGIDTEYFAVPTERAPIPQSIIYTGNMNYFPNQDAMLYFVKDVFPLVRAALPSARLFIVGNDPPYAVRRLRGNGVTVTGFVRNIKEYYLQSMVAIAPVRIGAGTLNKMLEPMALGIPVVATETASRGLPLKPGVDFLAADTPQEFADALITLMNDESLRKRLSDNALKLVRASYGWGTIAGILRNVYTQLLHDSSRS